MHIPSIPTLAVAATLFSTTLAQPAKHANLPRSTLTASQLESIAPKSGTCAGAPYPSQCRTATQALPFILQSFSTYSITTPGAQAAIITTIAVESGDFEFQIHYYPSPNPGQGTRNMQSAALNLQYATSLQLGTTQAAGPNGVLDALIANDTYDFGSAAWFLNTQCAPSVKAGLATGGTDAFSVYLECIGTTLSPDREAYWQRALAALGVQATG